MRRAFLFCVIALAILLQGRRARADEKDRGSSSGLVLGARTGVGFPVGTTYGARFESGSRSFSDSYAAMVPLFVDAGYRFGRLYLGGWVQYGFAVPTASACPATFSCSSSDVRLGFAADYHLLRRATWDPWLGVGLGYEWTSFHAASPATTLDESLRGLELFDLEGGLDFDAGRTPLRLGGFFMMSFAQFTDFSRTENGALSEGKIADELGQPEPHGWFVLGVRGRLDL